MTVTPGGVNPNTAIALPDGVGAIKEDSTGNRVDFSADSGDATDELTTVIIDIPGAAIADIDVTDLNTALGATGSAVVTAGKITITFVDASDVLEVRINAVVHLLTRLPAGAVVPIGWVAVGDPATILPPDRHDEIWAVQKPLDFPKAVFGVERAGPGETEMPEIARRYTALLARHKDDRILDEGPEG